MSGYLGDFRGNKVEDEEFLESHLVSKEPFGQFKAWMDEAISEPEILDPTAMCLSTANKEGIPSGRLVLLKSYDKEGFKFFTNYESKKGKDIKENPNVAATFYWAYLSKSIRIEGKADKVDKEEADTYFHSRPVGSQLAANACKQSTVVKSRQFLNETVKELEEKYRGKEVPMPENWGGYLIRPRSVEFIRNQKNRLTDRIRFRRPNPGEKPDEELLHTGEDGWVYERLAP